MDCFERFPPYFGLAECQYFDCFVENESQCNQSIYCDNIAAIVVKFTEPFLEASANRGHQKKGHYSPYTTTKHSTVNDFKRKSRYYFIVLHLIVLHFIVL